MVSLWLDSVIVEKCGEPWLSCIALRFFSGNSLSEYQETCGCLLHKTARLQATADFGIGCSYQLTGIESLAKNALLMRKMARHEGLGNGGPRSLEAM